MHEKELKFVDNFSLPASVFHDVQTASATCQSLAAAEVEFYQTSSDVLDDSYEFIYHATTSRKTTAIECSFAVYQTATATRQQF